jgi:hypothetical protein
MPSTPPKEGMRRLTVDLADEEFFLLREEALNREKKGQKITLAGLIREAIRGAFHKKKGK